MRTLLSLTVLAAINACAARQCPVVAGAEVPLTQLIAQTKDFEQCRVTTHAFFAATGSGPAAMTMAKIPSDQTAFRIGVPGQNSAVMAYAPTAAAAMNGIAATLPNARATPLFTMKPGTAITLRGVIEYHNMTMVGDMGNMSRIFRADQIEIEVEKPAK